MKFSVEDMKAVAEAAISARQTATDAKAAADAADGTDEDLNAAHTEAERVASEAESKALSLSSSPAVDTDAEVKKQKLLRKRGFIDKDLRALGVDVDAVDEDEDEDLDKPLTLRDLQKIETLNARQTAEQLADAIADPLDRQAVKEALKGVVPTKDPEKDFKAATAIANIDRNSKILEEISRNPVHKSSPTGAGAPANREVAFVPTAVELGFMRAPFNLTKADILKARGK